MIQSSAPQSYLSKQPHLELRPTASMSHIAHWNSSDSVDRPGLVCADRKGNITLQQEECWKILHRNFQPMASYIPLCCSAEVIYTLWVHRQPAQNQTPPSADVTLHASCLRSPKWMFWITYNSWTTASSMAEHSPSFPVRRGVQPWFPLPMKQLTILIHNPELLLGVQITQTNKMLSCSII